MSSFCVSTQCQEWLMDPEDLIFLRARSLALSKESHNCTVRTLPDVLEEELLEFEVDQSKRSILEQEEVYITKCCHDIQLYFGEETNEERKTGKRLLGASCHWRVAATAIVYFRRFFLNNNLSDFDPRVIM